MLLSRRNQATTTVYLNYWIGIFPADRPRMLVVNLEYMLLKKQKIKANNP